MPALTVLFVTLACGAIGFADDFIKLTHRRSLGLSGRWKLILLGADHRRRRVSPRATSTFRRRSTCPRSATSSSRGRLYVLLFFVIAGTANGVNLTDGLDGLAAGTTIIAIFTFTAMNVIAWIRSGPPNHRFDTKLDLAIIGAALIGGAIGFLWYNAFPAEVFMGDTGSMALGGALGAFAIMTQTISLLLLIGGIFLIEALSVIIQVFTFKYLGRRVFLMTPIHHHFEMKAWSETKIMVRFWIVTGDPLRGRVRALLPLLHGLPLNLPSRVVVLGLARSGRAAQAALERRGVEVRAADRTLGNDAELACSRARGSW